GPVHDLHPKVDRLIRSQRRHEPGHGDHPTGRCWAGSPSQGRPDRDLAAGQVAERAVVAAPDGCEVDATRLRQLLDKDRIRRWNVNRGRVDTFDMGPTDGVLGALER